MAYTKEAKDTKQIMHTPSMRQYQGIKQQYPNAILLFRMGDFYELFFEDAKKAAPVMEIALTSRQGIPMAGVPYHSVENYLSRLLNAGYHVAIAEQEPDPRNPRLLIRRVRRVITPGTVIEEKLLNTVGHNYLMALVFHAKAYGFAFADISTSDFFAFEVQATSANAEDATQIFRDYYAKFNPSEVLIPSDLYNEFSKIPESKLFVPMESWKASSTEGRRQIQICYGQKLQGLGYKNEWSVSLGAVSLILHYVQQTFPAEKHCLQAPLYRSLQDQFMLLDEQSIRNLDIVQNQREGGNDRTLYKILNRCKTPAGSRLLKESLLFPLTQLKEIRLRQQIVNYLVNQQSLRDELSESLKQISDLERILTRLHTGRGTPRDFIALSTTIDQANQISILCQKHYGEKSLPKLLVEITEAVIQLQILIQKEVHPEPPIALPGNTPFLQKGVDARLDQAREAANEGSRWIVNFEKEEKKRTGIQSLRVKYNKIHGYFIEISRGQAKQAPKDYHRKQTLVSYERFSNEALAKLETTLYEAESIVQKIELERFCTLCQAVLKQDLHIKKLMRQLAYLDFLLSLAQVAAKKQWTCPALTEESQLYIQQGSHPIVEHYLPVGELFTPNDLTLTANHRSFAILTGPNMAGKSTYIRQAGLIQLLAQVGSFVPAQKASLGICDRIFTRIGSGDNLTRGESTFFTEMLETAHILNQSTNRSLVIMDEIGRGTSTYDGLSLAWAIVKYLSNPQGPNPLTLFATHYHELTELSQLPNVFNLTMEVQEEKDNVVFLHSVAEGVSDRSYGIYVARLAGLPQSVIEEAEKKLADFETNLTSPLKVEDLPTGNGRDKTDFPKVSVPPNKDAILFASKPSEANKKIEIQQNQDLPF